MKDTKDMDLKKPFETPVCDLVRLCDSDIITASGDKIIWIGDEDDAVIIP